MPDVQPAAHLRCQERQRSSLLQENGYERRVAAGVWEHLSGDQIAIKKVTTLAEPRWLQLIPWIERQNGDLARRMEAEAWMN